MHRENEKNECDTLERKRREDAMGEKKSAKEESDVKCEVQR